MLVVHGEPVRAGAAGRARARVARVSVWALERDLATQRGRRGAGDARADRAAHAAHAAARRATGPLLLKLETLQRSGSFKVRGAASAITAGRRPRAIVAASTGNHGLAVAAVAGALGIPCRVFVPAGAAPAKLARLRGAGCEL